LLVFSWFSIGAPAEAADTKTAAAPDSKSKPKVVLALPLGLAAGTTAKIVLRGMLLDQVTEVRFQNSPATAKILAKGKANLPDKADPQVVGDTQVEVEVTIPADVTLPAKTATGEAKLVVVGPAGSTPPHALLVAAKGTLLVDKKAVGFADAQPLALGQAVDGVVEHPKQVHVYRIDGKAGQKIVAEVIAARQGSLLDSLLTLYDEHGNIAGANDDFGGTTDSRLEITLPTAGPYYLSLVDAFDLGDALHVFRLTLR
jgi:hypothetical protein